MPSDRYPLLTFTKARIFIGPLSPFASCDLFRLDVAYRHVSVFSSHNLLPFPFVRSYSRHKIVTLATPKFLHGTIPLRRRQWNPFTAFGIIQCFIFKLQPQTLRTIRSTVPGPLKWNQADPKEYRGFATFGSRLAYASKPHFLVVLQVIFPEEKKNSESISLPEKSTYSGGQQCLASESWEEYCSSINL